jgi:hypothetical protein
MTLVSMYVLVDRWSFGFRVAQAGMSAGWIILYSSTVLYTTTTTTIITIITITTIIYYLLFSFYFFTTRYQIHDVQVLASCMLMIYNFNF